MRKALFSLAAILLAAMVFTSCGNAAGDAGATGNPGAPGVTAKSLDGVAKYWSEGHAVVYYVGSGETPAELTIPNGKTLVVTSYSDINGRAAAAWTGSEVGSLAIAGDLKVGTSGAASLYVLGTSTVSVGGNTTISANALSVLEARDTAALTFGGNITVGTGANLKAAGGASITLPAAGSKTVALTGNLAVEKADGLVNIDKVTFSGAGTVSIAGASIGAGSALASGAKVGDDWDTVKTGTVVVYSGTGPIGGTPAGSVILTKPVSAVTASYTIATGKSLIISDGATLTAGTTVFGAGAYAVASGSTGKILSSAGVLSGDSNLTASGDITLGAVATFTGNITLTDDAVLSALAAANLPQTQLVLVKGGAVDITGAYVLSGTFAITAAGAGNPVVINFKDGLTTGTGALGPSGHEVTFGATVVFTTPVKLTAGAATAKLEAGAVPLTAPTTITAATGATVVAGNVTGAQALTLAGAGDITVGTVVNNVEVTSTGDVVVGNVTGTATANSLGGAGKTIAFGNTGAFTLTATGESVVTTGTLASLAPTAGSIITGTITGTPTLATNVTLATGGSVGTADDPAVFAGGELTTGTVTGTLVLGDAAEIDVAGGITVVGAITGITDSNTLSIWGSTPAPFVVVDPADDDNYISFQGEDEDEGVVITGASGGTTVLSGAVGLELPNGATLAVSQTSVVIVAGDAHIKTVDATGAPLTVTITNATFTATADETTFADSGVITVSDTNILTLADGGSITVANGGSVALENTTFGNGVYTAAGEVVITAASAGDTIGTDTTAGDGLTVWDGTTATKALTFTTDGGAGTAAATFTFVKSTASQKVLLGVVSGEGVLDLKADTSSNNKTGTRTTVGVSGIITVGSAGGKIVVGKSSVATEAAWLTLTADATYAGAIAGVQVKTSGGAASTNVTVALGSSTLAAIQGSTTVANATVIGAITSAPTTALEDSDATTAATGLIRGGPSNDGVLKGGTSTDQNITNASEFTFTFSG